MARFVFRDPYDFPGVLFRVSGFFSIPTTIRVILHPRGSFFDAGLRGILEYDYVSHPNSSPLKMDGSDVFPIEIVYWKGDILTNFDPPLQTETLKTGRSRHANSGKTILLWIYPQGCNRHHQIIPTWKT